MRPNYLLLLAALLGLSQCKNNSPTPTPINQVELLPPATQTGRETFGFLLNGRAWNLNGNPSRPAFTADYTYPRLQLRAIGGIDSTNTAGLLVGGTINIYIINANSTGTYVVSDKDSSSVEYTGYNSGPSKCLYSTDNTHLATVTVTRLDFNARIVSGTFSFILETPGCKNVVVTQGRFDSLF
jgi:hypothetical protein